LSFRYSYLSFLSSLIRRRPTSTLFPYTTLFRSECDQTVHIAGEEPHQHASGCFLHPVQQGLSHLIFVPHPRLLIHIGAVAQKQTDRKSTRLNSSHVKISYAVFCLKKKKGPHDDM